MNLKTHATARPVREFLRQHKTDLDYCVGGLMDYGYSEPQIENMLGLKPGQLDAIIIRNQYDYPPTPTSNKKGEL